MTKKDLTFEEMFAILPDVGKPTQRVSVDTKTREAFDQVNAFVVKHGREPEDLEEAEYEERSLARKLKRIRSLTEMRDGLLEIDEFGLLGATFPVEEATAAEQTAAPKEAAPLPYDEPIIASEEELAGYEVPDDLSDILDALDADFEGPSDIFNLRHVQTYDQAISQAEYKSQREPCPNFHEYKPLFEQLNTELKNGIREPLQFRNEQEIKQGQFFILNGVMVYVAEVGEFFEKNNKKNARLKVIFSNGTQGENLLRSLATELYKDPNGRRISDPRVGGLFSGIAEEDDIGTGVVYVLQSLSTQPAVAESRTMLHKIGVTKGSVQQRIANAENEPTYLLAPVKVVAEFEIYNIKARSIEKLLHAYFDKARAEITIPDRFGKPVKSREWFMVPRSEIKEAVDRLIDGSLGDTVYDPLSARLMPKRKTGKTSD
jgi:hypothetical protein